MYIVKRVERIYVVPLLENKEGIDDASSRVLGSGDLESIVIIFMYALTMLR